MPASSPLAHQGHRGALGPAAQLPAPGAYSVSMTRETHGAPEPVVLGAEHGNPPPQGRRPGDSIIGNCAASAGSS
eukprot:7657957-Pyramimonas_sp.AAC.1